MKMDTLFWKQLNPNIIYEPTKKQFFSKFCYKLVLRAEVGRALTDASKLSIPQYVDRRIDNSRRHPNWGGSWRHTQPLSVPLANIPLLEELQSIKNGYGKTIKIRIEEPWLQIYTKDEDTLKQIAKRLPGDTQSYLISVSTPGSAEVQALLEQDSIVVSKDNGFKYKIIVRNGKYGRETKLGLLNYMQALGEVVSYPKSFERQFTSDHSWVWDCYFYANDLSILTAINIIQPGLTGKIHKLVVAGNK
jgi:hypothetical protein